MTAVYAIGALQVMGTIISAIVVDMTGRKKLFLFGSIGIAISIAALGTHIYITETAQCDSVGNSSDGHAPLHRVIFRELKGIESRYKQAVCH